MTLLHEASFFGKRRRRLKRFRRNAVRKGVAKLSRELRRKIRNSRYRTILLSPVSRRDELRRSCRREPREPTISRLLRARDLFPDPLAGSPQHRPPQISGLDLRVPISRMIRSLKHGERKKKKKKKNRKRKKSSGRETKRKREVDYARKTNSPPSTFFSSSYYYYYY